MRGKKVKQLRRDLRVYDDAHPVLSVVWPRAWWRKAYWLGWAGLVRGACWLLGLRHGRAHRTWAELCTDYPSGKVIRLEPKFRDLKKTMRRRPLV